MRHGAAGRRSRNRGGHGQGGQRHRPNNRAQVFDSNGPDVRIRGTAYQIHEKYMALARDASGSGDYILAESYLQHAEHYQRMINSWAEADGYRPPSAAYYDEAAAQQQHQQQNAGQPQQQQQGQQPGKEDLGLPSSLFAETPAGKNVQTEDA
jgi:hypothetical protein